LANFEAFSLIFTYIFSFLQILGKLG
jgi:hypothetical protein